MRELQIAPREPDIDSGIPPVRQITQCDSRAKANKCLRNTFCGRKEVQSYLKEAETTEWARKAARQRENERRCRRVGPR